MDEQQFKNMVATNIAFYRKQCGLTQAQLAEKLSYSDKAVSKWERGEALPDVYIMKKLAASLKVTVDLLLNEKPTRRILKSIALEKRIILPLMTIFAIYFAATIVFGLFLMLDAPIKRPWLCFIYTMPLAALSYVIYNIVWKNYLFILIFTSVFIWSSFLAAFLSFSAPNSSVIFVIAAPLQAIVALWYILNRLSAARKKRKL